MAESPLVKALFGPAAMWSAEGKRWKGKPRKGPIKEADDDHFYGAWKGGSKAEGGHPAKAGLKQQAMGAGAQPNDAMAYLQTLQPTFPAAAVEDACQKVRDLKSHEEAYVIGPDGKVLLHKGGGKTNVDFDASESHLLQGSHVVHNHPSGVGLSSDDVATAVRLNVASVTAIGSLDTGQRYRYTLRRPVAGWPPKFAKTYWKAETIRATIMERDISRRVAAISDPAKAQDAWLAGVADMMRTGHHLSMLDAVAKDGSGIVYERTTW